MWHNGRHQSMPFLWHIVIPANDVHRVYRKEVPDRTVEASAVLLADALAGQAIDLPGIPGYKFTAEPQGRTVICTIWGENGRGQKRLLHFGIGDQSKEGSALWKKMTGGTKSLPAEPWCAIEVDTGLANYPGTWNINDLLSAIAWAWTEHIRRAASGAPH